MPYCRTCGTLTPADIRLCASCEAQGKHAILSETSNNLDQSPKNYAVAMALVAIFGVLGLHHFYLKNWAHGIIDLGLSVLGFGFLFFSNDLTLELWGVFLLIADLIHSGIIMYQLIVGKCRDGDKKLLPYPGQNI